MKLSSQKAPAVESLTRAEHANSFCGCFPLFLFAKNENCTMVRQLRERAEGLHVNGDRVLSLRVFPGGGRFMTLCGWWLGT